MFGTAADEDVDNDVDDDVEEVEPALGVVTSPVAAIAVLLQSLPPGGVVCGGERFSRRRHVTYAMAGRSTSRCRRLDRVCDRRRRRRLGNPRRLCRRQGRGRRQSSAPLLLPVGVVPNIAVSPTAAREWYTPPRSQAAVREVDVELTENKQTQ